VAQDVNMVNATLIADNMGIVVEDQKSTQSAAFSNIITLTIEGPGEKRSIAGTLFEGMPRIVKLRDYQVDFTPAEHMLILVYQDRPGMIGKIGTNLGEHDNNIGAMNLGRREKLGEAMVIISIDSAVPGNVIDDVRRATEANFVKALHMPAAKCSRGCGCGI
jgi:D-3-phosphoglycerate dehydrogenase